MEIGTQKNRKSFYQNKYLEYRAMVEATRDFSQQLKSAQQPAKAATPPELLKNSSIEEAKSKKPKSHEKVSAKISEPTSTKPSSLESAELVETPLNAPVASTGTADERMLNKVREYEPIIRAAAHRYNLPPELIAGVIWQESRGNARAVSHCGAMGAMQLMPATAASLGVRNAFDPKENIDGGAKYLRQMLDKFGRIDHAVAAYNAGPGNVAKFGGVPPFRETQDYVPKVLGYSNSFKVAGAFQQTTTPTAVRV